jgi:glycosyltransferase involved in cell wall biosynthesis
MFTVKVVRRFVDTKYDPVKMREVGDIYDIDTIDRLIELMGENRNKTKYVEFISSRKPKQYKRLGKKVIFRQGYLYYIGGIETFLFNFVKKYRDRNITIMCNMIEPAQLANLSKYADIVIDDQKHFECDILILGNYDSGNILHRAKADKIYQMIHADLSGMKASHPDYANLEWSKPARVDKVICVSETAAKGLQPFCKVEPEVIYNILDHDYEDEDGMTFITLSRATKEKGIWRMIEMAKKFKEEHKHFIWFVCCSLSQVKDPKLLGEIKSIPEFVIVPPSTTNKMLIRGCDYLVQLSDTESFCYSAFEALQRGVPVILTRFPEALNIVKEGENGYLLNLDLSDLDVDKIFNHKPKKVTYEDRCDYDKWEKVLKGEL